MRVLAPVGGLTLEQVFFGSAGGVLPMSRRVKSIKVRFCVTASKGYGSGIQRKKRCFSRKDLAESYAHKKERDGYRVQVTGKTYY